MMQNEVKYDYMQHIEAISEKFIDRKSENMINDLVCSMMMYLIQQYEQEQKKKELIDDALSKASNEMLMKIKLNSPVISDTKELMNENNPVVEVGQTRKWNKKYEWGRTFEVVGVVDGMVKTQYQNENGTRTFHLNEIEEKTELVTKLYTQEDLDRTAIQEYNKGKAVGYEEGYKSAEGNFKKMLEVHGYLK